MEWSALLTNLLVFIVLVGIIILSSYNIATYSDILNGNTNAPDIDSGECTAMIVVNSILIVASVLAIFFFIYRLIDQSLIGKFYNEEGDALYGTEGLVNGRWIEGYTIDPSNTKYFPNPKLVQYPLWLISTFVFTAAILNVLNIFKIDNGNDSNAVKPGGVYFAFSIIVCIATGLFFIYTTIRSLIPRRAAFTTSVFDIFKTASNKPVIMTKCECPPKGDGVCNMTVMDFNKAKLGIQMRPPIAPSKVSTSQYK